MEIIKSTDIEFYEGKTESLCGNKKDFYTITELIELLEEAKNQWGNKKVLIHDVNDNIDGFSYVYLNGDRVCLYSR